jgi:hypothetical protein
MLSFAQHKIVVAEQTVQNKHLDHLEDLMLLRGKEGLELSIAFMKDIGQSLRTGSTTLGISTKWDGKPAVVCGINPENKKFFVATKGAFNKEVKAFHTPAEIKKGVPNADLASKLTQCLKYLSKIGITGVLQGDLMFTTDSKKTQDIKGNKFITFMPNTIMYAVKADSPMGKAIASAKVGIAFHTSYSGNTMSSLSASSFNFNASKLKKTADVWFTDPNVYDITPALMKPAEYGALDTIIKDCEAKAKTVAPFLKVMLSNAALGEFLSPYINSTINGGMAQFSARGLVQFIEIKFGKEIDKLKTDKGKEKKREAMGKLTAFVNTYAKQFDAMFALHNAIANGKEILLNKFYAISQFGHFFVDEDGIRPTDPEGMVISRAGQVVKLVNRLRFSRQNRKVNA